jgi:hypothetical protein
MVVLEPTQTISLGDRLLAVANVRSQAARYGAQVRLLEDAGLVDERAMVRQAWCVFRSLPELGWVRTVAIDAYYDAYGKVGFQRALPVALQPPRSTS